jgi:hypothetical protein
MQILLHKLLFIETCYAILRKLRWEQSVFYPHCQGRQILKSGKKLSKIGQLFLYAKIL